MNMEDREQNRGYERSEINLTAVKTALIAFLVVAFVLYAGVWWLYQYWRAQDAGRDVRRSLVDAKPPIPPEPRLQVDPQADYQEYFRKQQGILKTYGWISREEGKVRIPIDRAMELMVEKEKR
jgi:hypothetical protein